MKTFLLGFLMASGLTLLAIGMFVSIVLLMTHSIVLGILSFVVSMGIIGGLGAYLGEL